MLYSSWIISDGRRKCANGRKNEDHRADNTTTGPQDHGTTRPREHMTTGRGVRLRERLRLRLGQGALLPLWTREPVRNQCLRAFFEALPVRSPVRNRAVGAKSVQSLKSKVQSPESKVRGVKGSCLKPAAAFRGSLLICAIRLVSLTSDKSRQGVRGSILLPYVGQEVQSLGPAFAVLQLSLRHYQVESAGLSKSQRTQRTQRTKKCRCE